MDEWLGNMSLSGLRDTSPPCPEHWRIGFLCANSTKLLPMGCTLGCWKEGV